MINAAARRVRSVWTGYRPDQLILDRNPYRSDTQSLRKDYGLCIGWAPVRASIAPSQRVIIAYISPGTSRLDYQMWFGLGFGLPLLALSFQSGRRRDGSHVNLPSERG